MVSDPAVTELPIILPVLFEGADLRAEFDAKPGAKQWVISFSHANPVGGEGKRFAAGLLASEPVSTLYVISKRNHWWQTTEMEVIARLARRLDSFQIAERIGYGTSMGGYGSLLWASVLQLDRVLAICPQVSITDPAVPLRPDWQAWISETKVLRDDIVAALPTQTRVQLLYDPWNDIDRRHAMVLRNLPNVEHLVVPGGGHPPYRLLQGLGILGQTTLDLLVGLMTQRDFRQAMRAGRPNSPIYLAAASRCRVAVRRPEFALSLVGRCLEQYQLVEAADRAAGRPFSFARQEAFIRNYGERLSAKHAHRLARSGRGSI